jgi:hypothetical protein
VTSNISALMIFLTLSLICAHTVVAKRKKTVDQSGSRLGVDMPKHLDPIYDEVKDGEP